MSYPTHFIIRADGTLVPVVAADELPDEFLKLIGVPAKLTPDQTVGLMCAGLLQEARGEYTIEVTEESDQGLIVNDDNEPAGPSTAVNKGKALAGDEVEPFRQERGPEDLPSGRRPRRNAPQSSRPFRATLTNITERDTHSGGKSSDRNGKGRSSDRNGTGKATDRKGKGVVRTGDMKI